jgi:NAD(P) transhydrogenase subunit alpha
MIIGVIRETQELETRVAATPVSAARLQKLGYEVQIEAGAGVASQFFDDAYREAGCKIVESAQSVWSSSDIVLKVSPPTTFELNQLKQGGTLISLIYPARNGALLDALRARGANAVAMDCIPRISRAQKMDVLSSMANIAGYRAILEAAQVYGGFFTGQITAAGKVPPAKVLVIGAGVAGLAAIGAARGLGAIVRAFDTRAAVKDQVKSLGADFLELDFQEEGEGGGGYAKEMSQAFIDAEMALFAAQAQEVDIIVTTALIPNKPAPKLITAAMVRSMKPGSVIVDMAAEQGGNCELTEPGKTVEKFAVKIIGYTDLPCRLPTQASTMYANNVVNLISDLTPEKNGRLQFNRDDDVVRGSLVSAAGEIHWPLPKIQVSVAAPSSGAPRETIDFQESRPTPRWQRIATQAAAVIVLGLLLLTIGRYAPEKLVSHLTVFVLACFVGWQVVWNVTPALHTPLMSVTNAISGIILIGATVQMQAPWYSVATLLAGLAVLIAAINVAGGFLVTHRMLSMFRKG